jgi:hypothetical protein
MAKITMKMIMIRRWSTKEGFPYIEAEWQSYQESTNDDDRLNEVDFADYVSLSSRNTRCVRNDVFSPSPIRKKTIGVNL